MKDTVLYSGIPGLESYKIKLRTFKCKQHFSVALTLKSIIAMNPYVTRSISILDDLPTNKKFRIHTQF